ncbi:MAG: hypothetical protein KFW09_02945 [Oscillospiraceae bacterium]|nr:hypothetical protein [Oscillospiraceae bacterium]
MINMFLNTSKEQSTALKNVCEKNINSMENIKKNISDFIDEDSLKGKSYDSAKNYLRVVYKPLITGIILFSKSMIKSHKKFISAYTSTVDSNSLKSQDLEKQIRDIKKLIDKLEIVKKSDPTTRAYTEQTIKIYESQMQKIKEKLEKLLNFDRFSVSLFFESESLLSNIQKGISQISNGNSWNTKTNSFTLDKTNLDWADNINELQSQKNLDNILNKIPNLDIEDLKMLSEYIDNHPAKDIPEKIIAYIKSQINNLTLGNGYLNKFGELIKKCSGNLIANTGLSGPAGPNSFVMIGPQTKNMADNIFSFGDKRTKFSTKFGYGLSFASGGIAAYEGWKYNDKTVGQSISYGAATTGVSIAGGAFGVSAVSAAIGLVFGTTPVGWAAAAATAASIAGVAVAVGIGIRISSGFEALYENNFLGLQDGLDWVGTKLDSEINKKVNTIKNDFKFAGKIIGQGVNFITKKIKI